MSDNILSKQMTDHISCLLDRYYSGEATPDEIASIYEFFRSVDKNRLPESLRDEAGIFALLDAERLSPSVNPPADLEGRIMAMIDACEKAHSRGRRRGAVIRLAGWLTASAAVAALLIGFGRYSDISKPDAYRLDADVSPMVSELVSPATQSDNDNQDEPDMIVGRPQPEAVTRHVAQVSPAGVKDNYIEITSPTEASILAQDVMALIREKIALAGNTVREANNSLALVDNTLRDVMAD